MTMTNVIDQAKAAMMGQGDGSVRIPPPIAIADRLEEAAEHGTRAELTLALRDYLLDGALRHTAAAGCPISDRAAQVLAAVMSQGLSELMRGTR